MKKSGFKMTGMSFKGESPVTKTRNYSKLSKSIKSSKFGKSKLGEVVGNVTEKIGNVQEKFIAGKKKLGLSTSGYDATVESSNDDVMIIDSKDTPSSKTAQTDAKSSTKSDVPEAGVNLEKVAAGPIAKKKKKAPTRKYKKKK
tara:strand:- start:41 stop:469 length:429 start_codon:yes stop_codon:yes gene_type:complete